jgi:hypothetical protein
MVYLNVDVNYDEDDYDEDDYVQYQHQYQLVYIDRLHCFYSNDDGYGNEKNSIKKSHFIRNLVFKYESYMIMFVMSKPMKKYF